MRYSGVLRRAVIASLALAAACSSGTTSNDGNGSAELTLTLTNSPEGVRSVEYVIACEDGFSFDGLMNVVPDRDPPIWEAIVGLPEGECDIVLTAYNDDGSPLCLGSTTIEVVAGTTVKADIELSCPSTGEPGVGNVDIDGSFSEIPVNICPIIHHMGAIPSQLREGETTSEIQVRTTDPDLGPEPLAIELSAARGTLTSPNAPDSMFICPAGGGQVQVTAKVSDGFPQCDQEQSVAVFCPVQGDACLGVDCSDADECTADVCTEGVCSNPALADGVSCDGGAGSCQSGECVPNADPCEGVDCNDGDDCTADFCVEGSCANVTVADGASCNDGAGSCLAGECVIPSGCENVDCNDDNECTTDSCALGFCGNVDAPDGQLCQGGAGTCQSGTCEISDACEGVNCDDGKECTADSCLAGTCANIDLADGTSCAGGTGSCQSGTCEPIDLCSGVNCDDNNFCTDDDCAGGICSNTAKPDGTLCALDAECRSGVCTSTGGGTPDPAISAGPAFCGDIDAQENFQFPLTGTFTPLAALEVGVPVQLQFETVMDVDQSSVGSTIGTTLFFDGDADPFEFTYTDYVWEVTGATPATLAHSVPGTPFDIEPDANEDQIVDNIDVSTGVSTVSLTPTGGPISIALKDISLKISGIQILGGGLVTWEFSTIPEPGEDPNCDVSLRTSAVFQAP